jgi:Mor family transcriptional regulator
MSFSAALVRALQTGCEMSEDEAVDMAGKIIEGGVSTGVAGSAHYWPQKFGCLDSEERDECIRREFNGRNLASICERYGVSRGTVYNIVRR